MYGRYKHLAIDDAKHQPKKSELQAIEDLLGAELPEIFLDFLNVANGASIEYVIDVPLGKGKTEPISFCSIFSTEPGNYCDETFIGEIKSGRDYAKIPNKVLPFARDGGGSIVYLDLTEEGNGRVVAFVQGLPEWTGLRTESAFIELAATFDEYIRKLRIDRNLLIDQLQNDVSEISHIDATLEWLEVGMPEWRKDQEIMREIECAKNRITK